MIKQYKIDEVGKLKEKLQSKGNFILTNYSGVKVKDLSILRRQLRDKNVEYKVVKNNLFKLALKESGYVGLDDFLKGPIGVAFIKDEIGETAKILKDFSKEKENFILSAGVVEKIVYNELQIKKIADLPSKEVLLAKTMYLINGPTTSIAMGMKQIIASVARGIKAVAEVNNK